MSTLLSDFVSSLSEGLHNDRCIDKSYLDYVTTKDDQGSYIQSIFRCFRCEKNYEKNFNIEFKDLEIYMKFAVEILINLFCY